MDNVNIAGSSNGAALTYQLLINTGVDRPFHRAFPMVSSLIGVQYNNNQFWKFSAAAAAGEANNFDTPSVPAFSSTFEVRNKKHSILLKMFYIFKIYFSMPISTALRMAQSSTRVRTLALLFSIMSRSSLLKSKKWRKI